MSEVKKDKILSAVTKNKISLVLMAENHPNYGKTHSSDTIALMSEAKLGKNHPR